MLAVAVGDGRSEADARALLAAEPAMTGRSLADAVSGLIDGDPAGRRCRVVVVDYGTKASIVHLLEQAGASVEVVRHDASAVEILALDPDGVLLANGPGDPGAMDSHAAEVRGLIDSGRPVFGICLGHQLVGRALGLETYKLPFGHRGANHPVLERETGRVLVTSQNHGFAVREPDGEGASEIDVTHVSLYDRTVEGLRLRGRPVWSMQFHPEASPGPHDARIELERFVDACANVHDRSTRVGA
jgi:carbamoyl-phosphate synthase small subunit